jgi:predicted phosphodiesterase
MRIAVVSDIHGNLNALNAVLEDLHRVSPDLVLHGGDLADGGSSPIEIVDIIRGLGWQGVMGNTDEMLTRPESLEEFASQSSAPPTLWTVMRRIADATRSALGDERLAWLSELPAVITRPDLALVHATPESCWKAPAGNSSDTELEAAYGSLNRPIVVFGHTHCASIRELDGNPKLLINTGSVGLPFDGDPRASYLVLDRGNASIRRIAYDIDKELKALAVCGLPGADLTTKMLRASAPQMP